MAINYTWDVSTVDTYPSKTDDNAVTATDVVYNVHCHQFLMGMYQLLKHPKYN